MARPSSRKKKFVRLGSAFIFTATLCYFSYHVVSGRNGILNMFQLAGEVEQTRKTLDEVQLERMKLEHRVFMLSKGLDKDLLDEQARLQLNRVSKDEVVVLNPLP
ncbi:MAG: septum formation initiator family protein [Hyphomicrobiales bacterium]|nr:septum formation initiator family protein [Hyphomicrobiales bacterium]